MASLYWLLILLLTGLTLFQVRRSRLGFDTAGAWVLLTLVHGLIFKPLFVQFEFPSRELLELTVLQQIDFDAYWAGSVLVLLPYTLFLVGMFVAGDYRRSGSHVPAPVRRVTCFDETILVILMLLAVGGIIGFFIQFPQLLETANKNSIATDDIGEYSAGGIWRALVELSFVASMCALVNIGVGRRRQLNRVLFGLTAILWLVFCFMSDQRGAMLFAVITYLIAWGRWIAPVPRRLVLAIGGVLVLFVVGKTAMRLQSEDGGLGDMATVMTNFIGQNLVENGKTVAIIKAVPAKLDYQFGKTYLDAVLILVPRAVFPGKSTVNLDTVVGNGVYDCGVFGACGVPPGLLSESFLNFGWFGVPVLAALIGSAIGALDRRFRQPQPGSRAELFFVYSLIFTGMSLLGSGASSVISQVLLQAVEIGLVCLLAGRGARLHRVDGTGPRRPTDPGIGAPAPETG